MPRQTLQDSARVSAFLHVVFRCSAAVALIASMLFVITPQVAKAAPSSSASCVSGAGNGGVASATLSVTQGGNGCVFIKYTISGTDYYETFNYMGADQSWTVPSGVSSAIFHLIDGKVLESPFWADTINVAPGERWTVVYTPKDAGVWAWHCHILTHAETPEGMRYMVTALIVK